MTHENQLKVQERIAALRACNGASLDLSSCGLTSVPAEALELGDQLELLNLGDNAIADVPAELPLKLAKLRVLFFANNLFESIPEVLSKMTNLYMLSFKSNRLRCISETCLPPSIGWLILTDNQIAALPKSIGQLTHMRKLMLSGNKLVSLPDEMRAMTSLELVRLAANKLTSLPPWLLELPKLSWIAFGGNAFNHRETPCDNQEGSGTADIIEWSDLVLGEKLGEGASGSVYRASLQGGTQAAVKIFRAATTSDGLPEDEMRACIAAGAHASCVAVVGVVRGHPAGAVVLAFKLVPESFRVLAKPPSFETVTRDVYPEGVSMEPCAAVSVLRQIASACRHLHGRGLSHGDLYGHNILVDGGEALLSDFGAASPYGSFLHDAARIRVERVEVRAFGCLVEELLLLLRGGGDMAVYSSAIGVLVSIARACCAEVVAERPAFSEIETILAGLMDY